MLSKRDYLALNTQAFEKLTKKEKDEKYKVYVNRTKLRTQPPKTIVSNKPMTAKVISNKNNRPKNQQNEVRLSKCLLSYARASIDPFDNITDMPCIPDSICAPSFKFRTHLDTVMTVGETGVGYAVMNPWAMAASNNLSDGTHLDFAVVYTTDSYNDIGYSNNGAEWIAGRTIGENGNSPYTQASLSEGSLRLVAAGLEVEYTGVLLNQSGVVSVIQWNGLESLPNPTSIGNIKKNPRTQTCPTSREARCYVRYDPTSTANYDYSKYSEFIPSLNPDLPDAYYPLAVIVSGATPGVTFRVRAVAFFELQLSNAPATPSESDPVGFPAFQAARTTVLPTQDPKEDLFSILKKTASSVVNTVSGFLPVGGAALGTFLGGPAAAPLGMLAGSVTKNLLDTLFN